MTIPFLQCVVLRMFLIALLSSHYYFFINFFIISEVTKPLSLSGSPSPISTSVELPFELHDLTPLLINSPDLAFHLEVGDTIADNIDNASLTLMDPQSYTCYYAHYFTGRDPFLYLTWDEELKPVFVSVERKSEDQMDGDAEALGRVNLRVLILATRPLAKDSDTDEWSVILVSRSTASSPKQLREALPSQCPDLKGCRLMELTTATTDKKLLALEEKLVISRYKFGVMYCAAGQTDELVMLQNQTASPDFEDFLNWLGTRVELKGYSGFRGDLDVKNGTTGEFSVATEFKNYDIMFHVSTLLEHTPGDEQQLSKKRYMGNDVVMILFQEGHDPVDPATFRSHFNHVFISVKVVKKLPNGAVYYQINTASKRGVRRHEPFLPMPPVFERNSRLRTWFLTKLINSQRAALRAPGFSKSLNRTREQLMEACASEVYSGTPVKRKNKPSNSSIFNRDLHKVKQDSSIVISGPTSPVRHIGHIGASSAGSSGPSGFEVRGIPPEIYAAMEAMKNGTESPAPAPASASASAPAHAPKISTRHKSLSFTKGLHLLKKEKK